MKTRKIDTTDYFMIGWEAYFADKVWDFMVLRDRDPWEVYYRESEKSGFYRPDLPNTLTIGEKPGWIKLNMDGRKLKNYFERYARPETWKKVSKKFYATHDVAWICDGPSMGIEFTKPNGKVKELYYAMHEFPEEWHDSYQRASRLLRYFERFSGAGKKEFAFFVGASGR